MQIDPFRLSRNTLFVFAALWAAISFSARRGSALLPESRGPEGEDTKGLIAKTIHTSETAMGVALSPNGSELALVTFRAAVLEHGDETEKPRVVVILQVWDSTEKRVLGEYELSALPFSPNGKHWVPGIRAGEWFVRYSADGKVLVAYDGERLHVLKIASQVEDKPGSVHVRPEEIRQIDLGLGPPNSNNLASAMEVAPDGSRVAVGICNPLRGSGQTIRVYQLPSGALLREWDFHTGCVFSGYSPLSWDEHGKKLAVSLPPFAGGSPHPFSLILAKKKNVLILDADTGKVLTTIYTGYIAGPVCFTKRQTVLTASLNADAKYFSQDTIREWDVDTGRLVRQIPGPPQGVHYLLALSLDGNTLLGYIGREKPVEHFLHNEYLEFGLWDYGAGKLFATSGQIDRPHPVDRREKKLAADFSAFGSSPERMSLDASGDKVLIWWQQSTRPFLLYDVPP